jgi:anthranilate synthase/aminodeoxychorismate synthase-like glutamine amidotransferase
MSDLAPRVLMIDNYDSFTYNLVHQFAMLGATVEVVRNDAVTADEAAASQPEALVISPGPGTPEDAGVSVPLVRRLAGQVPILGVCLGHQAIVAAFGGEIGPARSLVHGKASTISHDGESLFRGLPQDIEVGRYHSLAATIIPEELVVTARTADGEVMGVRHRTLPVEGVQFHPESVLTPHGTEMVRSFVTMTRLVRS